MYARIFILPSCERLLMYVCDSSDFLFMVIYLWCLRYFYETKFRRICETQTWTFLWQTDIYVHAFAVFCGTEKKCKILNHKRELPVS